MSRLNTINSLFRHFDWGQEKLLAGAGGLSREDLNREFEIGAGSLRKTLHHTHEAERIWIDRASGKTSSTNPPNEDATISSIRAYASENAARRKELFATLSDNDLDREIQFGRDKKYSIRMIDALMQVCNHGMHHRAQAIQMLRLLNVKPPLTEYLFMQIESPIDPPPQLSAQILAEYAQYTSWAADRVLSAAEKLDAPQLDQQFDAGLGTLRKTFVHLLDASTWWLGCWTGQCKGPFPEPDLRQSVADMKRKAAELGRERQQFLQTLKDEDLNRVVNAEPESGRRFSFPLGQLILDLCNHATHHRAHALNMLRHLGAETPMTDYAVMKRKEL